MNRRSSRKQKRASQSKTRLIAWVIVLIVVVLGGVWLLTRTTGDSNAQISVAEAATKRDQGAFVLDVRTQEEWDEFHIPDATLIPLDELSSRLAEIPGNQEIVTVCRTGNRSQAGRDILLDAGFTQVSSMKGGLREWRDSGYPTVSGP
jgi:rhodanese-related sulfurtransferase